MGVADVFNLNDKFALLAKTKSGKSYLGKIIQKLYPRRIVIDTTYEYDESFGEIIYGFTTFAKRLKEIENVDEYSIIFRFNHEDQNQDEIFEQICRLVFYLGDTFFVVEEIHLHSNTHNINHWLLRIATMGSHQGIGYLLTTQRPSLIHKTLLTQCDHIFVGQLIDENDISYVKSFLRDEAKTIHTLEPRNFIYFSHGQIQKINTNNISF